MVLAVTGHRPDKLNYEYDLNGPWSKHIREKLQETINDLKPTRMLSGMALGVDTIWAMLAIENNIPLIKYGDLNLLGSIKNSYQKHMILK
jgi:hypothetical protein